MCALLFIKAARLGCGLVFHLCTCLESFLLSAVTMGVTVSPLPLAPPATLLLPRITRSIPGPLSHGILTSFVLYVRGHHTVILGFHASFFFFFNLRNPIRFPVVLSLM